MRGPEILEAALQTSISRRDFLRLGLGSAGLVVAGGGSSIVKAATSEEIVHADNGEGSDLPPDEPAVAADMVIEDEEMGKHLLGAFTAFYQRCFSQVAASIHEYTANPRHKGRISNKYNPPIPGDPDKPGDILVGPLPNRRTILRAFDNRVNIIGRSTSDNGAAINFNGEPDKGPALIIQLQTQNCRDNRITATVTKLGEGGLSKQATIPSGRLQRFPFYYVIPRG